MIPILIGALIWSLCINVVLLIAWLSAGHRASIAPNVEQVIGRHVEDFERSAREAGLP